MYNNQYLYHHGIEGQKWGVRRYQNSDGSLTSAGRQRYGVIERAKIRTKGRFAERNQAGINFRRAKGFGNKVSAAVGYDRLKTKATIRSTTEKNLANASRTRLGKAIHNQRSANAQYSADYAKIMRHKSAGQKIIENTLWAGQAMKTPYARLSGRTTTVGKECVNRMLTLGIAGAIKDAQYLANKKKNANSTSN